MTDFATLKCTLFFLPKSRVLSQIQSPIWKDCSRSDQTIKVRIWIGIGIGVLKKRYHSLFSVLIVV
jgi:hypothetical protein